MNTYNVTDNTGHTWTVSERQEEIQLKHAGKSYPTLANLANRGGTSLFIVEYAAELWKRPTFGESRQWLIVNAGGKIVSKARDLPEALAKV